MTRRSGNDTPPTAPRDGISDQELARRMLGHLRPVAAQIAPPGAGEPRPAVGMLWYGLQVLVLAAVCHAVLFFPLLLATRVAVVGLNLTGLGPWLPYATTPEQVEDRVYGLLFLLVLIVAMSRAHVWADRLLASDAGDEPAARWGCGSYRTLLNLLARLVLLPAMLGRRAFRGDAGQGPGIDDPALVVAQVALVLATAPQPLNLEETWIALALRFPATCTDELAGKAFLALVLRELAQRGWLRGAQGTATALHPATAFGPTERLCSLLAKVRRAPGEGGG